MTALQRAGAWIVATLLVMLIARLLAGELFGPTDAGSAHPHVLIIVADDLGWGDVGYHGGSVQTPQIDALAAASVQLERFYTAPICTAARVGLMTGRAPELLGAVYGVIRPDDDFGLPADATTLGELFQNAGYETAMIGKWHLGHRERRFEPRQRGFEHSYGTLLGGVDYYTHRGRSRRADLPAERVQWHRNGIALAERGYATQLIADEARRIIANRDPHRPLFLYVPFTAPHVPLQAPVELVRRYGEAFTDDARRKHAAMVDAMDRAIGSVIAELAKRGLYEDTLILFLSDNGANPAHGSNGPLRAGKSTAFEGGVRVPALLKLPRGDLGGQRFAGFVRTTDVWPTLAAIVGDESDRVERLEGVDLLPWIRGTAEAPAERDFYFFGPFGETRDEMTFGLLRGDWKLLVRADWHSCALRTRLFSILDDPGELHDHSAARPQLVAELRAALLNRAALHPEHGLGDTAAVGRCLARLSRLAPG